MSAQVAGTSLPMESNTVSLDPEVEDEWGMPAIRVTYRDHPDDLANARFLQDRGAEILEAGGSALDAVEIAIGGKNVTTTIEGRQRFPIQVRVQRSERDDIEKLSRILIAARPGMTAEPASGSDRQNSAGSGAATGPADAETNGPNGSAPCSWRADSLWSRPRRNITTG